MKTALSIFAFALCVLRCGALSLTNGINGHVLLSWNCPTNQITPDLSFRIYGITNLTAPLSQWSLITNVAVTNLPVPLVDTNGNATNFNVLLNIQPQQYFFVATASNFWGESGLSNYANTPPAPQAVTNLAIQKAP